MKHLLAELRDVIWISFAFLENFDTSPFFFNPPIPALPLRCAMMSAELYYFIYTLRYSDDMIRYFCRVILCQLWFSASFVVFRCRFSWTNSEWMRDWIESSKCGHSTVWPFENLKWRCISFTDVSSFCWGVLFYANLVAFGFFLVPSDNW